MGTPDAGCRRLARQQRRQIMRDQTELKIAAQVALMVGGGLGYGLGVFFGWFAPAYSLVPELMVVLGNFAAMATIQNARWEIQERNGQR